jgi:hypothetical protein
MGEFASGIVASVGFAVDCIHSGRTGSRFEMKTEIWGSAELNSLASAIRARKRKHYRSVVCATLEAMKPLATEEGKTAQDILRGQ